ncbi:MAG: ExbD/TolR family protein [Kiritimatiellia bacterium]
MAKKSKLKEQDNPKLEMTPMIDVVFQLLIFFIVTLKQEDILSRLNANRPAPDTNAKSDSQPDVTSIDIGKQGFLLNKDYVDYRTLSARLKQLSSYSKTSSIIIRCTGDSPHRYLVQALDLCSKYGMTNLSIFSL